MKAMKRREKVKWARKNKYKMLSSDNMLMSNVNKRMCVFMCVTTQVQSAWVKISIAYSKIVNAHTTMNGSTRDLFKINWRRKVVKKKKPLTAKCAIVCLAFAAFHTRYRTVNVFACMREWFLYFCYVIHECVMVWCTGASRQSLLYLTDSIATRVRDFDSSAPLTRF